VLVALTFLMIGVETKGRSIEEIDAAISRPAAQVKITPALS
jgi:hypothetical protein